MNERNKIIISLFREHLGGFEVYEKSNVWHQRVLGTIMFWMWDFQEADKPLGKGILDVMAPLMLVSMVYGSAIGFFEGFLFGYPLIGLLSGISIGLILAILVASYHLIRGVRSINHRYMTDFISFIGSALYVPDLKRLDHYSFWRVLAHEFVHGWDAKRMPLGSFQIGYVLPQVLALCSILAIGQIWAPWMVWFGVCQIFLLPIPAPIRAWAERRGYAMSLATLAWDGIDPRIRVEAITENFTGGDYYWMWPFRSRVLKWFTADVERIKNGDILKDEPFRIVYEAIGEQK